MTGHIVANHFWKLFYCCHSVVQGFMGPKSKEVISFGIIKTTRTRFRRIQRVTEHGWVSWFLPFRYSATLYGLWQSKFVRFFFCRKEIKIIVFLSLNFATRALFCDSETSILPPVHQPKFHPKFSSSKFLFEISLQFHFLLFITKGTYDTESRLLIRSY
jgi:hypothetical protein